MRSLSTVGPHGTRRRLRSELVVGTLAGLLFHLLVASHAEGQYPSPPPDFSDLPDGAGALFSPTGGVRTAPLLLIYVKFSDVPAPWPPTAGPPPPTPPPPPVTAATIRQSVFGPATPSVVDYFNTVSNGNLAFTPARESQGTLNDGVVQVNGGTAAAYIDDPREEVNRALRLANPFVDFARYDRLGNDDGVLSTFELVVLVVRDSRTAAENCGAARLPSGTCTISGAGCYNDAGCDPDGGPDGGDCNGRITEVDGVTVGFYIATVGTATNMITTCHEIAHLVVDIADFYGYAVGSLGLGGPTCGNPGLFFQPNAFEKLHWGWITPTVVTQDGFYEIDQYDTSNEAYILYDHDRGTDDYFIVENRQRGATYENSASDSGLVIWRIDESIYGTGTEFVRPIEIMRPDGTTVPGCDDDRDGRAGEDPPGDADGDGDNDDDGDGSVDEDGAGCWGGDSGEAWNPADPTTPQRSMTRTWQDGTPAAVAVRAIGNSGATMCAYFDVRGRGILVDTYDLAAASPIVAEPGETISFDVDIRNTNDRSAFAEWFRFHVDDLPPGWSSPERRLRLRPQVPTLQPFQVTLPPDAAAGLYTLGFVGESEASPVVSSRACSGIPIRVRARPREPDRFETGGDEVAIDVVFDTHVHFDERILLDGLQPLSSTADVWTTTIDGLSLHNFRDVDRFSITLPDPEAVTPEHPSAIVECGFYTADVTSTIGEEIVTRGSLIIEALPPATPEAAADELRNAPEEAIRIAAYEYATFTPYRVVIPCPREPQPDVTVETYTASFGAGGAGSRIDYPEYRLRVTYRIDCERRLESSSWVRDQREARGAGAGGFLPCAGGFFPGCAGANPFERLEVVHPLLPGGNCLADGCPDFYIFNWARRGPFDLFFDAPAEIEVELLSLDLKPVARADIVTSALPAVSSPISGLGLLWNEIPEDFSEPPGGDLLPVEFFDPGPFQGKFEPGPNSPNGQNKWNLQGAPPAVKPETDGDVPVERQPKGADPIDPPFPLRRRILVDSLPVGDYVLSIRGPEGTVALQWLPTAVAPRCLSVAESDLKEGGEFLEAALGPVTLRAAIDANNVAVPFIAADCDDDGDLDLLIPWSGEEAERPVTIDLEAACGEGESLPTDVTVSLVTDSATVRALDADGNLVDSLAAASVYTLQNLTLVSRSPGQSIARIEIIGSQMCLTGVCWNCDAEEEPTAPLLTHCEATRDSVKPAPNGVGEVELGNIRITAARDAKNGLIPLQTFDCDGDNGTDVSLPFSDVGGTPAMIHLGEVCGGADLPIEVTVGLFSDNAVLRALDANGNEVDAAKVEPPYARHNITLTSTSGIDVVTIEASQTCITDVCSSCESIFLSAPTFLRADCNDDGGVDISDALRALSVLFLGEGSFGCEDACDANDDGQVDISDPIAALNVLFLGVGVIPSPGMDTCGSDPTDDRLSCEDYRSCP